MKHIIFSITLLSLLIYTACEDDEGSGSITVTDSDVNEWIEETMRDNYLWYADMPDKETLDFSLDPETFFEGLLSDQDGKDLSSGHTYFSTLEQAASTKSISDATDSYGFDFAIANLSSEENTYKIALVLYVLKDSPAEEAGLKRGDWIFGVNGSLGTIEDYSILRSGESVSLQLGKSTGDSNTLTEADTITIGASREVENTPFLKDSIYEFGSTRIGYLMYNHFQSGLDEYDSDDTTYDLYLEELFEEFKNEGVNEFVLDLRYNSGGYVTCAQLLASLLVPADALGETFCHLSYNDKNTDRDRDLPFLETSETVAGNLDLDRLFILTGSTTASASELVINSLRPYMGTTNVCLIGQQTLGKTVGMTVYNESDTYGWILSPVTFHSYNCEMEADYEDGFAPDVEVNEFDYDLVPFGELEDPLLAQAIYEITGEASLLRSAKAKEDVTTPYKPLETTRNNLYLIADP